MILYYIHLYAYIHTYIFIHIDHPTSFVVFKCYCNGSWLRFFVMSFPLGVVVGSSYGMQKRPTEHVMYTNKSIV